MKPVYPLLPILLLALLPACKKKDPALPSNTPSGLKANTLYVANTIYHDNTPVRVFTSAGEVTDTAVISHFIQLFPGELMLPGVTSHGDSAFLQTTSTDIAYYFLYYSCRISVQNTVFDMRQVDTSVSYDTIPGGYAQVFADMENEFYRIRNSVLDVHNSFEAADAVTPDVVRRRQSIHCTGTFANNTLSMPYTFLYLQSQTAGSNLIRYNLPLRPALTPQLNAGDTLVLQEGRMEFFTR